MSSPDEVSWARRVNSRWIVRESLRESASRYLEHLERADPDRLRRSCLRARRLTDRFGESEDPKPWFYAGLFSLATPDEVEGFLTGHLFTLATIPGLAGAIPGFLGRGSVSGMTWEKILRIRGGVTDLITEEYGP